MGVVASGTAGATIVSTEAAIAAAADRGSKTVKVLPRRRGPARAWWFARSWIPLLAVAAVALAPPGTSPHSSYALRWLAVALLLVAAIGRSDRRAALASAALAALGALYIAADSVILVTRGANPARLFYVAAAVIVIAISALPFVRRSRRFDPVLLVALQLAAGLVAYWLYYTISGLGLDFRAYQTESVLRAAAIELSLVGLAFGAIGIGVNRTWSSAAGRLGWQVPRPWHVALAVVVAVVLALSNVPLDLLMSWLMPHSQAAIADVSRHVFAGVAWWNLPLIAVFAGIGEETTFRGALQPRFGIVATAALFAMIHIQYGPTFVELWVFVHALIYGLMRRHINTTAAVIAHASYDLSAFLNGSGFALFCLIGLGLAAYLWREAARDPDRLWRALRELRPA